MALSLYNPPALPNKPPEIPPFPRLLVAGKELRFLPMIIGILVFVASITLALVLGSANLTSGTSKALQNSITVQLPFGYDSDTATLKKVLRTAAETAGVGEVRAMPAAENAALLKPWLGDVVDAYQDGLPVLVEVQIVEPEKFDAAVLTTSLQAINDNIMVDDHRTWLKDTASIHQAVGTLSYGIVLSLAAALLLAVLLTTQMVLTVCTPTIGMLHLVGASDAFIARQVTRSVFHAAALGTLGGFMLAIIALIGWQHLLADTTWQALLIAFSLNWLDWLVLACLPLLLIGVALISCHLAVRVKLPRLSAETV
jgi:cell division transport system permease protein